MKILVLAPHPFFQNRGTPIALKMLLEALSAKGHQLSVVTYPEGEDVAIPNCTLLRTEEKSYLRGIKPGFSWKKIVCDIHMFFLVRKLLKEQQFDVIHAGEEAVFIAKWFSKKHHIPYVYDMDSSLPQQLCEKMSFLTPLLPIFTFFERGAVRSSLGVLPVCKHLEDTVKAYDSNVFVQRLEDVSLLEKDQDVRPDTLLKKEDGTVVLMYVGNLEKYQGIDLLIEGFAEASKRISMIRLIVIGGAADDIEKYLRLVAAKGLQNKITFAGPKPVADLGLYLAQADILASPRIKGFNTPMKVYSYLDSGKPLLATDLPTHTQVLDDEISCLVEPTTESMAEGIVTLASDEKLRATLAENARVRVALEFTEEAFRKKLEKFYSNIENRIKQ